MGRRGPIPVDRSSPMGIDLPPRLARDPSELPPFRKFISAFALDQPLTAILSNAQAAQRLLARPHIDRVELEEILNDIVDADQHAGEVIRSLRLLLKKGSIRLPHGGGLSAENHPSGGAVFHFTLLADIRAET